MPCVANGMDRLLPPRDARTTPQHPEKQPVGTTTPFASIRIAFEKEVFHVVSLRNAADPYTWSRKPKSANDQ